MSRKGLTKEEKEKLDRLIKAKMNPIHKKLSPSLTTDPSNETY